MAATICLTDCGSSPMIAGSSHIIRAQSQIMRVGVRLQSQRIRAEIGDDVGSEFR